jgi:hypothetical protein
MKDLSQLLLGMSRKRLNVFSNVKSSMCTRSSFISVVILTPNFTKMITDWISTAFFDMFILLRLRKQ